MNVKLATIIKENQEINRIFDFLDISETTREEYKSRIKLFLEFTSDNDFNHNTFLEFKRYLAKRNNLAVSSKNKYLITAKLFLKELNRRGLIPVDITQNIKVFKQSRKHKKNGLNVEEVANLSKELQQLEDNPKNLRLKAILSFLLLQGLRQCEVVRLDIKDIDLVNNLAFVRGKGQDDDESINLHLETSKTLKYYLRSNKISDGALFVSKSNNSNQKRLTTRGLRGIIKKLFNRLEIDKSVHGTRHFFVSQLVKSYKGDLLEVARYSRHKSLEMLQVYDDNIKLKKDLPRFYKTFNSIKIN